MTCRGKAFGLVNTFVSETKSRAVHVDSLVLQHLPVLVDVVVCYGHPSKSRRSAPDAKSVDRA